MLFKRSITMNLVVFFVLFLSSCATQQETEGWYSWHDAYVHDACTRCPDCCAEITEEGFIDPYGVERPIDWLPSQNGENDR